MNARKSCGPFEISSYFKRCRGILFTTRSTPLVGETTDDPWWTFRPLAFRTFMIYSWRSQNARERVHASSEQPNEQRPARRHGKRVTMHYDLLCKRYTWDRYMYKRSRLSRCMKCSLDISEMWTFVCSRLVILRRAAMVLENSVINQGFLTMRDTGFIRATLPIFA